MNARTRPSRFARRAVVAWAACASGAPVALAGMPSPPSLTDLARARLEVVSFFLLAFLLSAAAVMGAWNYLRRDFAGRLPRLTYRRSLALTGLWGLLFVLVLTMISGARELMTPGAWEKSGATYRLTGDAPPDGAASRLAAEALAARPARIEALRVLLRAYALHHGGAFPPDDRVAEIPADAWETPDVSRARYVYLPGRTLDSAAAGGAPVAYEPPVFGARASVWVVTADGAARQMTPAELDAALAKHPPAATTPTTRAATATAAEGGRR